jgi:hypothetical protein
MMKEAKPTHVPFALNSAFKTMRQRLQQYMGHGALKR